MTSKLNPLQSALSLLCLMLATTACKPQGDAENRSDAGAPAQADLIIRDAAVYTVNPA